MEETTKKKIIETTTRGAIKLSILLLLIGIAYVMAWSYSKSEININELDARWQKEIANNTNYSKIPIPESITQPIKVVDPYTHWAKNINRFKDPYNENVTCYYAPGATGEFSCVYTGAR